VKKHNGPRGAVCFDSMVAGACFGTFRRRVEIAWQPPSPPSTAAQFARSIPFARPLGTVAVHFCRVQTETETPARGPGYGDEMTLRLFEGGSYFLVTDDCYRFLVNKIAPCASQSADRHGIVGLNE
jgi:hypothetical protein